MSKDGWQYELVMAPSCAGLWIVGTMVRSPFRNLGKFDQITSKIKKNVRPIYLMSTQGQ